MELIFPQAIYAGVVIILVIIIFRLKNKFKYSEGKKVANINHIEEQPLYKKIYRQYKILVHIALTSLIVAIGLAFGLLSRPAEVERINETLQNRDIFLCLDISDSMDEVNLGICKNLMDVVKELKGERFGISVFNGQSVTLVPLTTDYKYVIEVLDNLIKAFDASIKMLDIDLDDDYETYEEYSRIKSYKYEGTLSDRGSSIIGDGLASCLYSFPDIKENKDRKRLIIFATDNELNAEPYVTLTEAAALCKKYDVKVFAVATDYVQEEEVFKAAIANTGGKYYVGSQSGAYKQLVKDIEMTDTSEMTKTITRVYEQPQVLFICMVIFIGVYLVISRKVKL